MLVRRVQGLAHAMTQGRPWAMVLAPQITRRRGGRDARGRAVAAACSIDRRAPGSSSRGTWIDDRGEKTNRTFDQFLRSMGNVALEGQRISGLEPVCILAVAVLDDAFEHIDELRAWVFKGGEDLGFMIDGDQKRLE